MATIPFSPNLDLTTLKQGDILDMGANGQFTKTPAGGFQPLSSTPPAAGTPAPGAPAPAAPLAPASPAAPQQPGTPAMTASFPSPSILPSVQSPGVITSDTAAPSLYGAPSSQSPASPATPGSPSPVAMPTSGPNVGFLASAMAGMTPPTPPSMTDILKTTNVQGLQSNLASIQQAQSVLRNAYTNYVLQVNGEGTPQGIVDVLTDTKAKSMQIQLDSLNAAEQVASNALGNAMTYVKTMMDAQSTDYTNALNAYNSSFDRAYKFQDLFNTAASDQQKNAAAYLGSVQSMIANGGVNWNTLDPAMKATIQMKEAQAGWPAGTLESFAKLKPGANIIGTINGVDASGRNTVTFVYAKPDGTPGMMQTVNTGSYKETPLQIAQRQATLERTQQSLETARATEANRIIGPQARQDPALQRFNAVATLMPKLSASLDQIKANGINAVNAADLIDTISQINTGGNAVTAGQVDLMKQNQSYLQQAEVLKQKITGNGGAVTPELAKQIADLAQSTYKLYSDEYSKRVDLYNARLKNVNGQDLTAYSPLTDITNLPSYLDGSYDKSLQQQASSTAAFDLSGLTPDQVQQLVDQGLISQ